MITRSLILSSPPGFFNMILPGLASYQLLIYLGSFSLCSFTIYMFAFVADLCIFCTVYTIFYMYASPLLIPLLLVYLTQKSGLCRDHENNKFSEKIVQGSRGKFRI